MSYFDMICRTQKKERNKEIKINGGKALQSAQRRSQTIQSRINNVTITRRKCV